MTDDSRGMEGSEHRYRKLTRSLAASLLLGAAVAAAGCGGGSGGSSSTAPPSPASQAPKGAGGVVSADGTLGLVGPAARSTGKSQQFSDKTGNIPANANHKPKHANGVAGGENCQDTGITPAADNLDTVNAAILCLVNGERAAAQLPPLTQNAQLDKAASGMAARMVSEHFFSHDTPDGKNVVDRVEPTGYIPSSGDWVVGENLAWGSGALSTPQAIVNGWMNSPGHKANVLAPDYKDIGLAAALGSPTTTNSGGTVYVNNFGAKSGADLNATLPGHEASGSGNTGDAANAATVVVPKTGTTATAKAKAKAKAKKKARAKKRRKKRH
ncbi:MAG: hypothetical protein QOJ83_1543 [Frankiales bacterium]|nr:hypothetical protein [Frankiales bacterium]